MKASKKEEIIGLLSEFCAARLNEEYRALCVEMALALDDLPEAPLARGREEIWAAAIVYTVGGLNFLGDKSFEPYLPSSAIFEHFGVKSSTVGAKSRTIRDLLDIEWLDDQFATTRMKEFNPFNSLVMVDDMIVPISALPDNIQKQIRQARERGEEVYLSTK